MSARRAATVGAVTGRAPTGRSASGRAASDRVASRRAALGWSALNNVGLKLGGLALGIVLARLLGPEQFGTYAVALTVQALLMSVADLGLSAELIRCRDPRRRAPTVATLALVMSGLLTGTLLLAAPALAQTLGSPASAPVIMVLSTTLLLAGAGVVPFALLQRRFRQRALFAVASVDLAVSTVLTLALLSAGVGVLSLAIGRVAAQATATVLLFVFARIRPRFGLDRSLLAPVLKFSVPVAAANLLSWSVLGADRVVVAALSGSLLLGVYVLAANVSTWPMTAIGQVVRSVALPGFARADGAAAPAMLERALGPVVAAALLAGGLLSALAVPVVSVVYGADWAAAAPVLIALGLVGAARVVFDLAASFLLARGRSGAVLLVQLAWLGATVAAVVPATAVWGITGAGWASLAVALLVVLPAYTVAVARAGCSLRSLGRAVALPLAAAVPALGLAAVLGRVVPLDWLAVLVGGIAAAALYLLLIGRRLRRELEGLRAEAAASAPAPASVPAPTPAPVDPTRGDRHV